MPGGDDGDSSQYSLRENCPYCSRNTPNGFSSHLLQFCGILLPGGDDGIRTHDPLLAGQVLSQLSYTPILLKMSFAFLHFSGSGERFYPFPLSCVSIELFSRTVSRKVSSPLQSLTSVFGMGTGGPSAFVTLTIFFNDSLIAEN